MSIINSRWKRNSGILEPKGGENVNLTGTGQVASSGTILSGSDRIVDADTIYDYTNEAFKDVDAINISNVIFTLNNGTTLNESFGHMHIEYALVTNTVPLSGGTFTGALIGTDLTLSGDLTVTGTTLKSVTATIIASTTQTQGQQPLTSMINEVSTVANASDTVTMMSAVAGMDIIVINNGANTLQIFPASGDDLGAGVDTAVTLAADDNLRVVTYNATNWEVI